MSQVRDMADVLVPLHRQAVERTVDLLSERFGLTFAWREDSLRRAGEFYDDIPAGEGLIACHADPFDSACDFSVFPIPYEARGDLFAQVRDAYEAIMRELDEKADAELEARLGSSEGFRPS